MSAKKAIEILALSPIFQRMTQAQKNEVIVHFCKSYNNVSKDKTK